ncbi:3,4-dihydroxy-2-butanone-4-phosphate synthase [Saccharopolyspora phatthalungensis]|uniref:3,4-dihydroxy-2-butanone-4-phosphate synthase n=1 Tax=Saccharopolyspora phatthalungensis TaxID=664693 RepID=A0A840QKW6_9PSEU|nr:3,4-dihydroxy-2-butanone-4-phosphate synthase [Saccharopolyspora phatthalungensis]MBB5159673.1 3,4-dihydroxy-2-butanone 4-phosphate synthase [Saccharopolyspora phatthalungensis]
MSDGVTVLVDATADLGVLVLPAAACTTHNVAFLIEHTSGFICAAAPAAVYERLRVPSLAPPGQPPAADDYGVSFDAATGITTGISAADRARVLRLLASPATRPDDLARPGHVVSVRAREGGVLARAAIPEAACELVRRTGATPVAAYAHVVSRCDPTTLASASELADFAAEHALPLTDVATIKSGAISMEIAS